MSKAMTKRARRKKPTKRFDATEMVKTLEDMGFVRGDFSAMGLVAAADDGGDHWILDDEDLLVEVEIMPSRDKMLCRVGTVAGGGGGGIWKVPPVGAEVHVAIPDGDRDYQPVINSWYSGGQVPEDISPTVLVIAAPAGGNIYFHDGSGTVKELAFKDEVADLADDLDAHIAWDNAHVHLDPVTGSTSEPTVSDTTVATQPTGTEVVKAK